MKEIFNNIRSYFRNRFITKTHVIETGLKKGQWHELDECMLHANFNAFVKFVEGEQAYFWKDKEYKKKVSPKQAALEHFEWATNLRWTEDEVGPESDSLGQLTPQAISAIEQKKLWLWWTEERPKRKDPYMPPEELKEPKRIGGVPCGDYDFDLEQKYTEEDTEMLVRLMKIRSHLWT